MTHAELLKKIKTQEEYWTNLVHFTNPEFYENTVDQRNAWQALKAVVELHKANKYDKCECLLGEYDGTYLHPYPCDTIQAIEKELA